MGKIFFLLFSELLISRETTDSLLQLMVETLSQLDWTTNRTTSIVDKVAGAVRKYFQDKVNILVSK